MVVSIWLSHLVYRSGDTCYLEPYVPSRFARQFGYDQLYVGNPNTSLAFMGSLINVLASGGSSSLAVLRHGFACR